MNSSGLPVLFLFVISLVFFAFFCFFSVSPGVVAGLIYGVTAFSLARINATKNATMRRGTASKLRLVKERRKKKVVNQRRTS